MREDFLEEKLAELNQKIHRLQEDIELLGAVSKLMWRLTDLMFEE